MIIKLLLLLVITSTITNCTIQKRLHQPGWHIEWNKKHKHADTDLSEAKEDLFSKELSNGITTDQKITEPNDASNVTDQSFLQEQLEQITTDEVSETETTPTLIKNLKQTLTRHTTTVSNHRVPPGSREKNVNGGAIFIGIALLLLLGALLFGALLLSLITGPLNLTWLGLTAIAVALLFGGIVILAKSTARKKDQLKQKEEDIITPKVNKKPIHEMSEEELFEHARSRRGAIIAVGAVILLLIVMILLTI